MVCMSESLQNTHVERTSKENEGEATRRCGLNMKCPLGLKHPSVCSPACGTVWEGSLGSGVLVEEMGHSGERQ